MADEDWNDSGEPSEIPADMADALDRIVEDHFSKKDREDAWDLIRNSFRLLPLELQDLYHDVIDLYRQGKHEEASLRFEEWLETAREMGLI
jgi:hypothetical protein